MGALTVAWIVLLHRHEHRPEQHDGEEDLHETFYRRRCKHLSGLRLERPTDGAEKQRRRSE